MISSSKGPIKFFLVVSETIFYCSSIYPVTSVAKLACVIILGCLLKTGDAGVSFGYIHRCL